MEKFMRTIMVTIILLLAGQLPAHAHHEESGSFPLGAIMIVGIGLIAMLLVFSSVRARVAKYLTS